MVDIFSQLFSSYKGTEKGVLLEVEGVERSFDFVLVQAVLLLLSSARGRGEVLEKVLPLFVYQILFQTQEFIE